MRISKGPKIETSDWRRINEGEEEQEEKMEVEKEVRRGERVEMRPRRSG